MEFSNLLLIGCLALLIQGLFERIKKLEDKISEVEE
jgi:hypothetical protein